LSAGIADLGLALDERQLEQLDGFSRLLIAWTEAINLTAIREPAAVAREHLLDSLAAVPLLRRFDRAGSVLDLGSGGGLPGIPLAVALPDARVLLVESISKKARFLSTAVAAIGLAPRVAVANERAEALADVGAPGRPADGWDVVTVRAVAAMPRLIGLAFPLLRPGGRLVAWKRGDLDDELADGERALEALGGGAIDVEPVALPALADHRLVVVTKSAAGGRGA
jgi:16S rRNA (guanine527-N7)-methyltransferase